MKKLLVILMVVLLSLTACDLLRSLSAPAAPNPSEVAWDDRTLFKEGLVKAERAVLDSLPDASVYHIDLQIPDDCLFVLGREEVRYTNQQDVPLSEVYFRLYPNLLGGEIIVSAVKVDGKAVEPAYEAANSAMRVPLPAALQPGERVVIEMDFAVEVPQEMSGNYGLFCYFEGVLALNEFYPVIPVYDDEGWNVEIPPRSGDLTYLDASFYLVRVTAPAGLTVVASGVEIGREREGDNQILTLAVGPARDFYIVTSDRYTVTSKKVGETTVNSYAFPERADGAKLALQHAADAMASFNTRFGVYPYTEFDIVNTPMLALGMEYPGLVAIGLKLYDPDAESGGIPTRYVLPPTVAHEVAHQWFYNIVGNDQVDEPWVDEAVVQYATGLYIADISGEEGAEGYRDSWYDRWDRVDRADIPIGMPTGAYEGKEYGAIVYGRGPIFVAALAMEMGQATFDEFLRDYYESHKWGIGTAHGVKQLAERHCQCDLTTLFEEWVYEK